MAELDPQPVEPIEPAETPVETATSVDAAPPVRPRSVYSGMWGPAEIVVVAAGALALVAVIAFYLVGVVPSNRELTHNKSEADRLDAEVISARSKYGEITSSTAQVDKIVSSVDDFETRFLTAQSNGQSALYQRLNGLMASYGLVNTAGPDYTPLEAVDIAKPRQQESEEEKGRAKYRSLYPGVYVTTTVEGSYQNLRRFIREIETGREFVVISAIELAPSDTDAQKSESGATQASTNPAAGPNAKGSNPAFPAAAPVAQGPSGQPKGKMHGETVALHIEMAAYFRRPNFAPMSTGEQVQQ